MSGFLFGQIAMCEDWRYDKEYYRLVKIMRKTQHKFKADSIAIGLKLATRKELDIMKPGVCAFSFFGLDEKASMGMIWVLRSDEYPKDPNKPCGVYNILQDQKNSIVHEFVHFAIENASNENAVVVISNVISPVKKKPEKKKTNAKIK
jgi:hypothetical protein